MADALEVEPEAVTCDVTAGSVNLVFSVLVADQTEADSVSADAEAEFSTASAASALLNVTVLSAPVVAVDDGHYICENTCASPTTGESLPFANNTYCQDNGDGAVGSSCACASLAIRPPPNSLHLARPPSPFPS